MGRELAAAFLPAKHLFQEVDEALRQKLSRLMFEGPESELTLTENAQPALMAVSLAVMRVLQADGKMQLANTAKFVAGHSLGEYSALAAAGAIRVAEAARLLRVRGRAMQEAVPVGEGAMAALLGVDLKTAQEIAELAREGEICDVANDNAPGQIVVSGARSAIERAIKIAAEKGAKRSILLPVSAPFHCGLMGPAADAVAAELEKVEIRPPMPPLFANVSAAAESDPAQIKSLLVRQVTAMVRWHESVVNMKAAGVTTMVEIGAGRVLQGLIRRIDRELAVTSVEKPEEIEAFSKTL
jgi:[acyl-carrier-protein] S-malonyltransferase